MLTILNVRFGVRLYDVLGDAGEITLLTDGREIYVRTRAGELFNLLRDPEQPLLVVGGESDLQGLSSRLRNRRKKNNSAKPSKRSIGS